MDLKIREIIQKALQNLGIEAGEFVVEHPEDLSHGDYSTNVAMSHAKVLKINPKELAEKIVDTLRQAQGEFREIHEIQIAGPGFINFHLSKKFFEDEVKTILKQTDDYGKSDLFANKKILIEHSSPNLFKPFHVGHVMNNTIGESINRLARYSGAEVTTISYPSDVSLGIGKAIWAIIQDGGIKKLETIPSSTAQLDYLALAYVNGTKAYEDDVTTQSQIREITKKIYENTPSEEIEIYKKGKDISLKYFKETTKLLGSSFDDFIFESEAGKEGKRIVESHTGDIFEKSDGAVVYKGEQDGLHTRVFINKEGYPTYEAKDIGLLALKFNRYSPDLSIFITDHDQEEYFKVVVSAGGKINKEWQDKTVHRTHGRMSFKGKKMSSRLGGVPLASTLIDTLCEEVRDRAKDISDQTCMEISIAALKLSILRVMAGKNINFDPDTSLSFEGDSGPYLQYSIVRARSVIEKSGIDRSLFVNSSQPENWQLTSLERHLYIFPEIVKKSTSEWAPHHLVTYLFSLSQAFNSWYGNTKIIDLDDKSANDYKLALTEAFTVVMKNGLNLLGIEVPEKM